MAIGGCTDRRTLRVIDFNPAYDFFPPNNPAKVGVGWGTWNQEVGTETINANGDYRFQAQYKFLVFTHVTFALTTVAIRHVGAQTNALNREPQWERKLKSVLCVVLCCGSRSDWDKLIGLYRISSVVFATRRIWGRTDYRMERKIKNKSDQSRRHGIERTANGYLASILFLESQPLKHDIDWVPTLQLAK